jgi:hypothetical protein
VPGVKPSTVSHGARTVMTNNVQRINLRKYLRPNDLRDFVKDNILPFDRRCRRGELLLYANELELSSLLSSRCAANLKLLKEATDLSNRKNRIDTRLFA